MSSLNKTKYFTWVGKPEFHYPYGVKITLKSHAPGMKQLSKRFAIKTKNRIHEHNLDEPNLDEPSLDEPMPRLV